MAKPGSKSYKKPSWIDAVSETSSRKTTRVRLILIVIVVAAVILFMMYQILFTPKVENVQEAIQLTISYSREDGKTFGNWVGQRMNRLCKSNDTELSFDVEVVPDAPPRGVDRYDVFVKPDASSLPSGCPKRQSIAGVWAKDGELVGLDKGPGRDPSKVFGPTLPRQPWLLEFIDGKNP